MILYVCISWSRDMRTHAERPALIKKRVVTKDKKNEELNPEVLHFGGLSGEKEKNREKETNKVVEKRAEKVSRRYFHKEAKSARRRCEGEYFQL